MSSMSNSLFCFQHCERTNIFCFTIPIECPVCNIDLSSSDLEIPPFQIPSPFLSREPDKLCLIIKPTLGNFTRDFKKGDLLHIGITNSASIIYEFQESGISSKKHDFNWGTYISVSLNSFHETFELLDEVLENTKTADDWSPERYEEVNCNCFDYVVSVLNASSKSKVEWTKLCLTNEFISPAINKALRFLSVVRKVLEQGFYIQNTKEL